VCVIAVSPTGEKVAKEVFERMYRSNDDGFGLAYRARAGVAVVKGLHDEEEAWEAYSRLPEGVPHVLHFRLATHGGVKPELTHPFVVSEDSPLTLAGVTNRPVLAHNGVWGLHALRARELSLKGPVSDSRVLAAWLGKLARRRSIKEVLEEGYYDVLSAGRVVVVDPATWKIHVVGDWIREGDLLFSNGSFRTVNGPPTGVCDWKWDGKADWPALIVKEEVRVVKRKPIDLWDVAAPEAAPAEIEWVEPAPGAEPAPRPREDTGLAVLRRALFTAAAEIGPDAVEAIVGVDIDEHGDPYVVFGAVSTLEVWNEGTLWGARLWSGDEVKEVRSRFLVTNSALVEFVAKEAAALRSLQGEAGGEEVWDE